MSNSSFVCTTCVLISVDSLSFSCGRMLMFEVSGRGGGGGGCGSSLPSFKWGVVSTVSGADVTTVSVDIGGGTDVSVTLVTGVDSDIGVSSMGVGGGGPGGGGPLFDSVIFVTSTISVCRLFGSLSQGMERNENFGVFQH